MMKARKANMKVMQDATRYGFRDRDFFRKNDAVVVGECYEVPVFKKDGKFFVAYLVSDCTDNSERNSCRVSKGFGTKGEAKLAAMRCSVYPFLEFEERLEVYKGYVITKQFGEYVDELSEKDGLLYSAAMLTRRDLSGPLGDKKLKYAMIVRHTPLMKCVEDVKTYIDGIKRVRFDRPAARVAGGKDVKSASKDASLCDAGGWGY